MSNVYVQCIFSGDSSLASNIWPQGKHLRCSWACWIVWELKKWLHLLHGKENWKNNVGYACYTGKRIEEKTMATLVTWEGESEKNNGHTWRIGVPLLTRKSTCCAERPPDTLLLTLTETWWRLWCLSGRSTIMGKHWFCMALGGVSNSFQIASPSSVITNVMMGFAVLKM